MLVLAMTHIAIPHDRRIPRRSERRNRANRSTRTDWQHPFAGSPGYPNTGLAIMNVPTRRSDSSSGVWCRVSGVGERAATRQPLVAFDIFDFFATVHDPRPPTPDT